MSTATSASASSSSAASTKLESITLLGICEGGVFTVCYAALYPEQVKNLMLTITPIDFHAGPGGAPRDHGFINLWTRSLDADDIDRLIEANGNLPGELMSFVFSHDDAGHDRSPSTTSASST